MCNQLRVLLSLRSIATRPTVFKSAILVSSAFCSVAASAQFDPSVWNADIVMGASERWTMKQSDVLSAAPHQASDDFGLYMSFRYHPVPWTGVELSAETIHTTDNTQDTTPYKPESVRELSAAYLFHSHFRHLQPFVAIGGAYQQFSFRDTSAAQHRPAALLNVGVDVPLASPHFGFSFQAHSLWYKQLSSIPTSSSTPATPWVGTVEPTGAFYIRY